MAKAKSPVQLNITVTLNPASMEFLERSSKDGDLAGTLGGWCGYWIEQQSAGGLMLSPEDHDYCASLTPDNKRFKDSRSLVRAIERGLKRKEGLHEFSITVDPAYMPVIEDLARQQGVTTDELVKNAFNMVLAGDWLYSLIPEDGRMLPFTKKILARIAEARGKSPFDVDSADIYALVEAGVEVTKTQQVFA